MHVPNARQQHELVLGEGGVDRQKGDGVEGQVPGGVPGVLPLVGHGDDVGVVDVFPVEIAHARRRLRQRRIAGDPFRHIYEVELLGPEQTGKSPALYERAFGIGLPVLQRGVESVCVGDSPPEEFVKIVERRPCRDLLGTQAQPHRQALAGREKRLADEGALAPAHPRNRRVASADHVIVEAILERAQCLGALDPRKISVVLS